MRQLVGVLELGCRVADYWSGKKQGVAANIRLLTREGKWLAWNDKDADPSDASSRSVPGAKSRVEDALLQALYATNFLTLLGSGASFGVSNADGRAAPGMSDLWHTVRKKVSSNNPVDDKEFNDVVLDVIGALPPVENGEPKAGDIESLLSLCKMKLELMTVKAAATPSAAATEIKELTDFITQAEEATLEKVDFVDAVTDLPAHKALLQKLAKRSIEKPRVRLFTTNYDLCLEEAASRIGVVLVDGFSHSAEQRFNRDYFQHDIVRRTPGSTKADYVDGVFHLYKLHGSFDWRRRKDGIVIRSKAHPKDPNLKPVLIYPRSSKYQEAFEVPYLDMFAAFQSSLREPDTVLVVAGFGFADEHISSPIWSALESNLTLRIVVADPGFVPPHKLDGDSHTIDLDLAAQRPYQARMMRLVLEGDARITILNGRFQDLADAIPTVAGDTDRQRLQMRLDQVRSASQ